jgi:hypothetical protein
MQSMILGNNPLRLIFLYVFHKLKNYGFFFEILLVAAEVFPFAKTGGLVDVAGSLLPALIRL